MAKTLRDRFGANTEERLGRALSELLENPLLTAAIGRAFDAREKASQAQEVAMGALNIPSAADIERLTRRLRSVSHRLEGIEDGMHQLSRSFAPAGVEARLAAIERQLESIIERLDREPADRGQAAGAPAPGSTRPKRAAAKPRAAKAGGAKSAPR